MIKFWRYHLAPLGGKAPKGSFREFEWATVVLDSTGFFAVVSDYGNYCFKWSHFTGDFRRQILKFHPEYVLEKIAREDVVDYKAIKKSLKVALFKYCKNRKDITEFRKQELRLIADIRDESSFWEYYFSLGDREFGNSIDWCEIYSHDYSPQARMFVERILPRLKEAIKAELEAEDQKANQLCA